jgi:hypothetical protein
MAFGKMSVNTMTVDKMTIDKIPVDEMPLDEMSFYLKFESQVIKKVIDRLSKNRSIHFIK